MQDERAVLRPLGAAEGGGPHARVDGGQVVVQGVQVLQEVTRGRPQHLQDLVVAGLLAEFEEHAAEQFEDVAGRDSLGRKKEREFKGAKFVDEHSGRSARSD